MVAPPTLSANNSKRQFKITAKLMQTFENLLLQNYFTEF